jgi:putative tryptophan/tyrosine transport system substrate-binding protein
MRRRDFIKGITVSTTWPIVARAEQTAKTHHIALVHPSISIAEMSESGGNPIYAALFRELRRLGYIEGVNLVVARYSGEGREERFPELCQEIARTKPDVIVASSSRLALSCKAATATVPIVAAMADPVPSGLVVNVQRREARSGASVYSSCAKLSRQHRRWGSSVRIRYGASRR